MLIVPRIGHVGIYPVTETVHLKEPGHRKVCPATVIITLVPEIIRLVINIADKIETPFTFK